MCPLLKPDALVAKKCGRANRFSLFLPSPTLLALLTYFAHILFGELGVNRVIVAEKDPLSNKLASSKMRKLKS